MPKLVLEGVFRVERLEIEAPTLAEVKDVLDHIGVKGTIPRNSSAGALGVATAQDGFTEKHSNGKAETKAPAAEPEAPKRTRGPNKPKPETEQMDIEAEIEKVASIAPPATRGKADVAEKETAPASKPAARGAAKGKVDVEKLQGAGRLREVVAHLMDVGYSDLKEIVAVCQDLQESVPLLQRVSDIPARIQVAFEVCSKEVQA